MVVLGDAVVRDVERQVAKGKETGGDDSVTKSYLGVGHSSLIFRTQLLYSP